MTEQPTRALPQDGNADSNGPNATRARRLPERIGPYRITGVLGEGGMGVVYLAEQENPRRRIALKVMRSSLISEEARRRFAYEARVLARLNHPFVAQIYDVGEVETPDGASVPYFAMEWIEDARSLGDFVRQTNPSLTEKLALVVQVLEGVQHGHQRGVIHRDLKPGNVLIDREGRPKIIDFGIARVTSNDDFAISVHTATGQVLGTPQYMSPEQFSGDAESLDSRSDVYSLGVLVFELVSGRLPHDFEGKSIVEAMRTVRETPPRRLSTLDVRLRRDLDTIVGKALAQDRERRYPSASALAADLGRFLRDEPISARPPSAFYHLRMFARRNKVLVGGIAGVFLVSLIGAIVSARFAWVADQRADEAQRQAYRGNLLAAGLALDAGQISAASDYLRNTPIEQRAWEWRHLEARTHLEAKVLALPGRDSPALATSRDGRWIAAFRSASGLWIWDARTGERVRTIAIESPAPHLVSFDSTSSRVTVAGDSARAIWWTTWDVNDGRVLGRAKLAGARGGGFAFASDDSRVAVVTDGVLRIAAFDDGRELVSRTCDHEVQRRTNLAFSCDGARLAVSGDDQSLYLLDASDLHTISALPESQKGYSNSLALSPDGDLYASASDDGKVRVWDIAVLPISAPRVLEGHGALVNSIDFSPDGSRLASASNDGTARVWDSRSGKALGTLNGHEGVLSAVRFLADGSHAVSASGDGTLRVWDLDLLDEPLVLRGHASFVNPLLVTPSGARLISGGWDGLVDQPGCLRFWDASTGVEIAHWKRKEILTALAISPSGARLLASSGHALFLFDATTGRVQHTFDHAALTGDLAAFTPDSDHLLYVDSGGLHRIDCTTFAESATLANAGGEGDGFALSRDARLILRRVAPTALERIDPTTLRVSGRLQIPGANTEATPAWPPWSLDGDGRWISVDSTGRVSIFELESGRKLGSFCAKAPFCVSVSPDGARIAVGANDITLWDGTRFDEVAQLIGHRSYVFALRFSRDGETLYSSSGDGTLRIWETKPIAERFGARRERANAVQRLAPRVRALFDRGLEPSDVVAELATERFESEREREIALQLALKESMERSDE